MIERLPEGRFTSESGIVKKMNEIIDKLNELETSPFNVPPYTLVPTTVPDHFTEFDGERKHEDDGA